MTDGTAPPSRPAPPDEALRVAELAALQLLDGTPEAVFEQIARLAAGLCAAPVALIAFSDATRHWLKAGIGVPGLTWIDRDPADGERAFEVGDVALDQRFASHPLRRAVPALRFLAAVPIALPSGGHAGSLWVVDHAPRRLDAPQREALAGLAALAATTLSERLRRVDLDQTLARTVAEYQLVIEGQSELVSLADEDGTLRYVNGACADLFGLPRSGMVGRPLFDFVPVSEHDALRTHLRGLRGRRGADSGVNRMLSATGRERWVAWTNRWIAADAGRPATIHSVGRDVTEQRLAEQALADSETLARGLYDATPAMLHSIAPDGRLLHVTDMWLDCLGYTRAEVIGRPSVDFLTPASRERALATVVPAFFASGRVSGISYQMVRKDGTVIDVLMSAVLERDAQGRPTRSFVVVDDVTERLATTAALAESTRMLQLVLDNLPGRISYWDAASRNRFANEAFLRDFRVTQEGIAGRPVHEVVEPELYRRLRSHIDLALTGQPARLETSIALAGGTPHDMDLRFTPDLREGRVHGLIVFALDITARREAERGLVERETRFKLLVDGVRDYAIYMLDAKGHVATWNAGADRNKGYRSDQVLGRHFAMFFTEEDVRAGKPEQALAQAEADGRFETEDWRQRADGSRFWAGVVLSAIRDESGQLLGFAKITRDMTERHRQQAATETALAEKETLLKEVYHRVKNNLQVVQSLLTLRGHTLPDGAARIAIDDSVQRVRAMALVHEKLYQSRSLAAISLPGYVHDLMAHLAEAHGTERRQVRLRAHIAALQTGLDSAVPFGLLLTELISNCLKHAFLGREGGEVHVSLQREAGGDRLRVADNGIGFSAGFDVATQTASLGLQLAAGLAQQLGGELQAGNDGGAVVSALLTRL